MHTTHQLITKYMKPQTSQYTTYSSHNKVHHVCISKYSVHHSVHATHTQNSTLHKSEAV